MPKKNEKIETKKMQGKIVHIDSLDMDVEIFVTARQYKTALNLSEDKSKAGGYDNLKTVDVLIVECIRDMDGKNLYQNCQEIDDLPYYVYAELAQAMGAYLIETAKPKN